MLETGASYYVEELDLPSVRSHTPRTPFAQRAQGNNVSRATGTVALDAEEHHQHHCQTDYCGDSQRPLNAENRSGDGGGAALLMQSGKRFHQNHQHGCAHSARNLTRGIRHR